ncbi:hypothetical protein CEXT_595901 [Caerostris extrusa]|uniref:Uncharacterized protein n=1 Tax=Caerostris extrusa TaxID=172846 RepID=A0AAV4XYX7_CAEEX|nr:hypothetical protein CEXT_595901 [Caerostris extrusa]
MTAECMVVLEHVPTADVPLRIHGFNIFNVSTLLLTADFSYIIVPHDGHPSCSVRSDGLGILLCQFSSRSCSRSGQESEECSVRDGV